MASEKLFYLQNGVVGNTMYFWKHDCRGYTSNLAEAHLFTESQAMRQHAMRDEDIPWPKEYIDAKAVQTINVQHVSRNEAYNETSVEPAP
jgi:hypothetical protein